MADRLIQDPPLRPAEPGRDARILRISRMTRHGKDAAGIQLAPVALAVPFFWAAVRRLPLPMPPGPCPGAAAGVSDLLVWDGATYHGRDCCAFQQAPASHVISLFGAFHL